MDIPKRYICRRQRTVRGALWLWRVPNDLLVFGGFEGGGSMSFDKIYYRGKEVEIVRDPNPPVWVKVREHWWQFWRPKFKVDPQAIQDAFLPGMLSDINKPSVIARKANGRRNS